MAREAVIKKLSDDVDDELLNEFYGWDQAARAKKMLAHYAGRLARTRGALVTKWI